MSRELSEEEVWLRNAVTLSLRDLESVESSEPMRACMELCALVRSESLQFLTSLLWSDTVLSYRFCFEWFCRTGEKKQVILFREGRGRRGLDGTFP